jgi:ElaB/YqjD/DUF883 family membrane-anchored ribosome-binding protein
MDNANGNDIASVTPLETASNSRKSAPDAMQAALGPGLEQQGARAASPLAPGAAHRPASRAPQHVHGNVLEGGDSPAVLAQPAAAASAGQGSSYHPDPSASKAVRRARRALSDAQDAMTTRYRRVSDGTDDYVHDNPWKSIALAAVGGLLVGLLVSR